MRAVSTFVVCVLCALAPGVAKAGPIGARTDLGDVYAHGPSAVTAITELEATTRIKGEMMPDAPSVDEFEGRRQQSVDAQDDESVVELWTEVQMSDVLGDIQITEAEPQEGTPESDNSGDEKDFASNPTPISEGRRRAGLLGILAVIAITTLLGYGAYTRREHLKELISDLAHRLPSMPVSLERLKYIRLPSLSIPTISAPQLQRTRRRRLRRHKAGGFRAHSSRGSRASTNAEGLLYDYDYDGDYERGPGYGVGNDHSGSSSSSDSYAHEAEAFDLGADEDFMIGAPRRSSLSPPLVASSKGGLRKGMSMSGVLGRWKRPGSGSGSGSKRSKGRRSSIANANANVSGSGAGTVLFAVADGDDDLEMELETDEALPLAPTPHRFNQGLGLGMGMLKGYGSAG